MQVKTSIINTAVISKSVAPAIMSAPQSHCPIVSGTSLQGTKTQNKTSRDTLYRNWLKRPFEVALILLSFPLIVPMLALGCLLACLDGAPPIYTQWRVGRDGRKFRIFKLRTMYPDAEHKLTEVLLSDPKAAYEWHKLQKLRNDPRITPVGRLLRKSSLDELPQIFNLLRGDMALVGPRPIMLEQQHIYKGQHYDTLRPGLTGLWQVSSRHNGNFDTRATYDDIYGEQLSFLRDIKIICQTLRVVMRGTGC